MVEDHRAKDFEYFFWNMLVTSKFYFKEVQQTNIAYNLIMLFNFFQTSFWIQNSPKSRLYKQQLENELVFNRLFTTSLLHLPILTINCYIQRQYHLRLLHKKVHRFQQDSSKFQTWFSHLELMPMRLKARGLFRRKIGRCRSCDSGCKPLWPIKK